METAEKIIRRLAWAVIIAFLVLFFIPFVGLNLFEAFKRDPNGAIALARLPGCWIVVSSLTVLVLGLVLLNRHWKAAGRGSVWRQTIPMWVYLCAGLLISGSCMTAVGTSNYLEGRASEKWPTTMGTIQRSQLGSGIKQQRLGPERRYYYPEIRFRYRVGDREYASERINGDSVFVLGARDVTAAKTDPSDAQRTLTRYPEGGTVRVFYDPEDPGNALLEPGVTWNAEWKMLLGPLLFVSGCALLVVKSRRATTAPAMTPPT